MFILRIVPEHISDIVWTKCSGFYLYCYVHSSAIYHYVIPVIFLWISCQKVAGFLLWYIRSSLGSLSCLEFKSSRTPFLCCDRNSRNVKSELNREVLVYILFVRSRMQAVKCSGIKNVFLSFATKQIYINSTL
jgi:hypothetical protein